MSADELSQLSDTLSQSNMDKNGKSVASHRSRGAVSTGHHQSGSVDQHPSDGLDHSLSADIHSHQSGEIADLTNDHHPVAEDESVESEEAQLLQAEGIYALTNGYIYFHKGSSAKKTNSVNTPKLPDKNSPLDSQDQSEEDPDASKNGAGPTFRFVGRKAHQSIRLFGDQTFKMIRELRNAYQAYHQNDTNYKFVVGENKTHRVTLEVSEFQDKTYLMLRRYFKNVDGYGPYPSDPNTWYPTKSVVSLDPFQDNPTKILLYALRCTK